MTLFCKRFISSLQRILTQTALTRKSKNNFHLPGDPDFFSYKIFPKFQIVHTRQSWRPTVVASYLSAACHSPCQAAYFRKWPDEQSVVNHTHKLNVRTQSVVLKKPVIIFWIALNLLSLFVVVVYAKQKREIWKVGSLGFIRILFSPWIKNNKIKNNLIKNND